MSIIQNIHREQNILIQAPLKVKKGKQLEINVKNFSMFESYLSHNSDITLAIQIQGGLDRRGVQSPKQ